MSKNIRFKKVRTNEYTDTEIMNDAKKRYKEQQKKNKIATQKQDEWWCEFYKKSHQEYN